MDRELLHELLESNFPDIHFREHRGGEIIVAPSWLARDLCLFFWEHDDLKFDVLYNYTAIDIPPEKIELLAQLYSTANDTEIAIKFVLDRRDPRIRSFHDVWRIADWFEREIHDLFGVIFPGHPHLDRLFLPKNWEGYPLLKDYEDSRIVERKQVTDE